MGSVLWRAARSLRYGCLSFTRKVVVGISLTLAAPALAEPVTIAALGDSLTQGYGLPVDQGFVPQLEGWLQAQGHDVALINAGVSGDTTQGGLSRVAWTLTPEVDALIVALGGNDFLRGLDPAVSRANLRGILEVAQGQGVAVLVIGLPAPGNYGPDYKQALDAMYPDLAAEFGALHIPSFLGALEARSDEPGAIATYMQADGIHPSAEGVALIVGDVGPVVADLVARIQANGS